VTNAVPAPPSPLRLAVIAAAFLLLLELVGVGWATASVPAGMLERAALAPAFGVAAVVIAGVVADRLGVPLNGVPAAIVVIVIGAAGWGAAAGAALRRPAPGPS
jgi:hypothetical protein